MDFFQCLVVDDSKFDRELYLHLLGLMNPNPKVRTASTYVEAKKVIVEDGGIDCFLLDITLPDGVGSDLIPLCEQHHPSAAIIMLTSDTDIATAMACMQMGADDYLIKGEFNVKDFHRTIQYAMERRQTVNQRRQLQEALAHERALNAIQRNFITLVAHEFKTPLAIISSALQFLNASQEPTDIFARQYNKMTQAIARLDGLMNNVLMLRKTEDWTSAETMSSFVLQDAVTTACNYVVGDEKNRLSIMLPANEVSLAGTKDLFEYALSNLIKNALNYSPKDTRIGIEIMQTRNRINCIVSNEGDGFSPEILEHIGTRFLRGQGGFQIAGVGLGLYLAIEFSRLNGGAIYICSEPNCGAKVVLQWPVSTVSILHSDE